MICLKYAFWQKYALWQKYACRHRKALTSSFVALASVTGIAFFGLAWSKVLRASVPAHTSHASHSSRAKNAHGTVLHEKSGLQKAGIQAKIARFILAVRPRKGQAYANRMAAYFCQAAKKSSIDPELVVVTSYVESELSMDSGPCIGTMQVDPRTYHERYRYLGYDPETLSGNICLGARELSDYQADGMRKGKSGRSLRAYIWDRYNGHGKRNGYVTRAERVFQAFLSGDACEWKRHLARSKPLWLS